MIKKLTIKAKLKMFDEDIVTEALKAFDLAVSDESEIAKQLDEYYNITKTLIKIRNKFNISEKKFRILEDILYSQCALEHTRVGYIRRKTREFGFGVIDSIRVE